MNAPLNKEELARHKRKPKISRKVKLQNKKKTLVTFDVVYRAKIDSRQKTQYLEQNLPCKNHCTRT